MKRIIIIVTLSVLLLISLSANPGTTYYVDATGGNDSNSGLTEALAWKTIAKVNASSFSAGDSIFFKRGETWRETLTVPSSGSSGSPITFGTYGTGEKPRILGSNLMTGWAAYEGSGASTWTATEQTGVSAIDDTDSGFLNIRNLVKATSISISGTQVRLILTPHSATTFAIEGLTIGPRSGTTDDFSAAPTPLLYEGLAVSATNPIILTGGGSDVLTDWTTFTLDETADYLIHIWQDDDISVPVKAWKPDPGPTNMYYSYSSTDFSQTQTWSGTAYRSIFCVKQIDVNAPPPNVWQKTGVTTAPNVVIFNGTWGEYESGGIAALDANYEWYWASNVLYVYTDGGDPDTQWPNGIDVGQRNDGVVINTKSYITIENLDIRYTNRHGINMTNCDYLTIQDSSISKIARMGLSGYAITNCTFDNIIWSYGSKGVGISDGSDNNIIQNCDFSESRTTKSEAGGGGLMLYDSDSNIIRYNYLHDAKLVENDRQGDGIYLNSGGDCNNNEIYYNVIVRFNDGIDIYGDGNSIYNNVIGSNQYTAIAIGTGASNNIIKNNIVYDGIVNNYLWDGNNPGSPAASNTIDYNCYYDPDNPDPDGDPFIDWNATGEAWGTMNWNQWIAHGKYDQHSIYADPKFTDPATGDFTPRPTSPCINAGTNVGLTRDYEGKPIFHAPDIGAYEDQTNALFISIY
jgi:hypothetical protein